MSAGTTHSTRIDASIHQAGFCTIVTGLMFSQNRMLIERGILQRSLHFSIAFGVWVFERPLFVILKINYPCLRKVKSEKKRCQEPFSLDRAEAAPVPFAVMLARENAEIGSGIHLLKALPTERAS